MKLRIFFDNEATNPDDKSGFSCNIRGGSKKKVMHLVELLKRAIEATPEQDKL